MSVIAAAVKHLMAAGITGDALLVAIAELEAEIRCEPKPRSSGAIRQERYRRNKASQVTESYACDGDGEEDKNPPQTPHKNSYTPVTPKGVTAPKGAVRNRGSRIDENWTAPAKSELPPETRKLAEQWTEASYRAEAEAFVNFWLAETGAKASKSNWNRAWANRITQIHSKVMRDQKFGNAPIDAPVSKPIDSLDHAERSAALYRKMGRDEDARAMEERAARLRREATGPPRSIGEIVNRIGAQ